MENNNKNSKLPYKSVEEGKAHYSRLAAQNNWWEEDEKYELEQNAKLEKAKMLYAKHDYKEALNSVTDFLSKNSQQQDALLLSAKINWELGRSEEALSILNFSLSLYPFLYESLLLRAEIYGSSSSEYTLAIADAKKALELNPLSIKAMIILVETIYNEPIHKTEELIADTYAGIERIIAIDATYSPSYILKARILFSEGKLINAETEIRNVILQDPENLEAYGLLARILTHSRRYEEAIEVYKNIIRYEKYSPITCYGQAYTFHLMGRNEEALQVINAHIQFHGEDMQLLSPATFNLRANILEIIDLIKLIESNKSDYELYIDLAKLYFYSSNYRAGLDIINKCIELKPDYVIAYKERNKITTFISDYSNSISDLEQMIQNCPTEGWGYYCLGNTFIYQDQYKKGFEYLEKAVKLGYTDALKAIKSQEEALVNTKKMKDLLNDSENN